MHGHSIKNINTNPAKYITTKEQDKSLKSITDKKNGLLYTMEYSADYKLDEILNASLSNIPSLTKFISTLLLNTSLQPKGKVDGGCSAFAVTNKKGEKIYGRNFDYKMDMTAVLIHTSPQNSYSSIGLADTGWIGFKAGSLNDGSTDISMAVAFPYLIMDGMNEKGLAASILKLDGFPTRQNTEKKYITTTVALRLILDRAANVEEAINLLKNYDMCAPLSKGAFHFLLSDAEGKNVVVEYCNNKFSVINHNYITNFYIDSSMNCFGHGKDRYDILKSTLSFNNNILSEEEAMSLLQLVSQEETEESTSMTQWSVVYNLNKLTAHASILRDYDNIFKFSLKQSK